MEFCTAGHLKDAAHLFQILMVYFAQCSGAFAVVVGTQLGGNVFNIVVVPAPYGTLFRMQVGVNSIRMNAVADVHRC